MHLYLIFQEGISGIFETLTNLQTYIYVFVGVIIAYVGLRTGIPDRLASGWEKLSGMQDRELAIGEREVKQLNEEKIQAEEKIKRLTEQIVDLTREVDVRREINRQDANQIKDLKEQVLKEEEIVSRLRMEIRNLNK